MPEELINRANEYIDYGAPIGGNQYSLILQDYVDRVDTLGKRADINTQVENLLDALSNTQLGDEQERYDTLFASLDSLVNTHLYELQGIFDISDESDLELVYEKVESGLLEIISFLEIERDKTNNDGIKTQIQNFIDTIERRTTAEYVEEEGTGRQNVTNISDMGTLQRLEIAREEGRLNAGYFDSFVSQIDAIFNPIISKIDPETATSETSREIRDLLIAQQNEIHNLHEGYVEQRETYVEATKEDLTESANSLLFEPHKNFGENRLYQLYLTDFYPGSASYESPEFAIAIDQLSDIETMSSQEILNRGTSMSFNSGVISNAAQWVIDSATEYEPSEEETQQGINSVRRKLTIILGQTENEGLRNRLFEKYADRISQSEDSEDPLKVIIDAFLYDMGISIMGGIQNSFESLQSQLTDTNSTTISFENEAGDMHSVDFSILYSTPGEEGYIADPGERKRQQILARQKSILSTMTMLERIDMTSIENANEFVGKSILEGVAGILTLTDIEGVGIYGVGERIEETIFTSIAVGLIGRKLLYANPIANEYLHRGMHMHRSPIRNGLKNYFNTNDEARKVEIARELNNLGFTSDMLIKQQERYDIIQYYISRADRATPRQSSVVTRLEKLRDSSNIFHMQSDNYFHNYVRNIVAGGSIKRNLPRYLGWASRVTPITGGITEGLRYIPRAHIVRDPGASQHLAMRVIRGQYSAQNSMEYHRTLLTLSYLPDEYTPGMNTRSSSEIRNLVNDNRRSLDDTAHQDSIRQASNGLKNIDGIVATEFEGTFEDAIQKQVDDVIKSNIPALDKFDAIIALLDEKGIEAEKLANIFNSTTGIVNLDKNPLLLDMIRERAKVGIIRPDAGKVGEGKDIIGLIESKKIPINKVNEEILGLNELRNIGEADKKVITDFLNQKLVKNIKDNIDVDAKLGGISEKITTITRLYHGDYNRSSGRLTQGGAFNEDFLNEFTRHRDNSPETGRADYVRMFDEINSLIPGDITATETRGNTNPIISLNDAPDDITRPAPLMLGVEEGTRTITGDGEIVPPDTDSTTTGPIEGREIFDSLRDQKFDYALRARVELGIVHGRLGGYNFNSFSVNDPRESLEDFMTKVHEDIAGRNLELTNVSNWDLMADDLFNDKGEFISNLFPNSVQLGARVEVELADIRARSTGDLDPNARLSIRDAIVRALKSGG